MKKIFLIVCTLFIVNCLSVLNSQAQVSELKDAIAGLENKVKVRTLANGLKIIAYQRSFAPIFSGVISVRVGGSDEKLGQTGISHMLEHMAFKGTETIGTTDYKAEKKLLDQLEVLVKQTSNGQLDQMSPTQRHEWEAIHEQLKKYWVVNAFTHEYEIRGAEDLNASTDQDITQYVSSFPKNAFEFWCWAETQRILYPVMRQFYKERDVVMEERLMRFENQPEGKLYELLIGTAFFVHPYRYPTIGYDFDIKNLTAEMISEFHHKYYVANNIVVSIVGDINDQDLDLAEKYFSKLPAGPAPERPTIVEPVQQGRKEVVLNAEAEPTIYLGYKKPVYPHPDDALLTLVASMLASTKVSPLYTELVKNRRMVISVDQDEVPSSVYPNLLTFSMQAKSPFSNQQVEKAFLEIIEKFKNGQYPPELLEIAKRKIAIMVLGAMKSNLSLAKQLSESELIYEKGWRSLTDWFEQIAKANDQDIQRVAKKYLQSSALTIGRIEKKASN